jgi:hypothetical protein
MTTASWLESQITGCSGTPASDCGGRLWGSLKMVCRGGLPIRADDSEGTDTEGKKSGIQSQIERNLVHGTEGRHGKNAARLCSLCPPVCACFFLSFFFCVFRLFRGPSSSVARLISRSRIGIPVLRRSRDSFPSIPYPQFFPPDRSTTLPFAKCVVRPLASIPGRLGYTGLAD